MYIHTFHWKTSKVTVELQIIHILSSNEVFYGPKILRILSLSYTCSQRVIWTYHPSFYFIFIFLPTAHKVLAKATKTCLHLLNIAPLLQSFRQPPHHKPLCRFCLFVSDEKFSSCTRNCWPPYFILLAHLT